MTITRKSLADTYAEHDAIIEAAQTAKREATLAYRGQLDGLGMDKDNIKAEIEGFKLAYRRKVAIEKKGEDVVEHRDAIADEIFLEITTSNAPRATRVEIIEEFDPATGEFKPVGNDADGAEDQVQVATVRASSSAQPVPAQDGRGTQHGKSDAALPASADASVNEDVGGVDRSKEFVTAGETAPHSEPASPPSEIAEPGDRGAVVPSAAPVVAEPNDYSKPNPWCLDQEECGLSSWDHFCLRCQRVKAERQAVEAVQ